jgi:hypothetical protein
LEHHFPHLYSQVGVGEMVVVDVQSETVGLDVVVTTGEVVEMLEDEVLELEYDELDEVGGVPSLQGSWDSRSLAT